MPQINKPNEYFNTVLYTGNGSTQSISGVNFTPDFTWVKDRSNVRDHALVDVVRGVSQRLESNNTDAEVTQSPNNGITSFDADGFSLGANANYNTSSANFASWNWLGGGTASSNTDGTITSQVSASTTSGFSIVSYTGTGSNATVGHGLGVAPKMVIFKNRDNGTQEWDTYHTGLTDATYFIQLNSSNAENNTNGALRFNSTAPSTNYFSVGTATTTNESGSAIIAYCFAEKKGFSKIGTYTGNGSTDGTFVYTGFKPAFVIVKESSGVGNWLMKDNKRPTYNQNDQYFYANGSESEFTNSVVGMDLLSNGFKCRGTAGDMNGSGHTIIYMAFAENPLVTSTGVPCTAR